MADAPAPSDSDPSTDGSTPTDGVSPVEPPDSIDSITSDQAQSLLPPVGGIPGALAFEIPPPDKEVTMSDLPPLSATVTDHITGLVGRIHSDNFDDAVAATREALAQVGVATLNDEAVITPAGPAAVQAQLQADEAAVLTLLARMDHGDPVSTYASWLFDAGLVMNTLPGLPNTAENAELQLRMFLSQWLVAGYGVPDELEINFVPQFLLACCQARNENVDWLVQVDVPTNATIDGLCQQLLAHGLQQALSQNGPPGTVATRVMEDQS